ncbi:MAG: hypothetical protein U5R30_00795 [Deltaproteobacteria bacterium]|nr:hypothetical protein [Deltaproteobacteria bacterium]
MRKSVFGKKSRRFPVSCSAVMVAMLSLLLSVRPAAAAGETACASVKIEIKQELTLERQAFNAHMRINNGLAHISLEDIDIEVSFTDEEGAPVPASADPDSTEALFFIRLGFDCRTATMCPGERRTSVPKINCQIIDPGPRRLQWPAARQALLCRRQAHLHQWRNGKRHRGDTGLYFR